jgi:mTERF domain-containing protein
MLRYIIFNSNHYRTLNPQKSYPLFPFQFSHKFKFCTTSSASESESESESDSFAVSYLINNIGFTRETALKALKRVRFKSPQKANSVFTFFRNFGFSDTNIKKIIIKEPWLLNSDTHNSILPKIQFFLSKGASISEISRLLTVSPRILQFSLENRIIPLFEFYNKILKSDKATICCMIRNSILLSYNLAPVNVKLLIDYGVCDSSIAKLLLTRPTILGSSDLINSLEEVKGLGFNPSNSTFGIALVAKKCMSKKLWDEKVDAFKKWGWSDEDVVESFRLHPSLMLSSVDKINLVMSFWVNQLGWNSLALTRKPQIIGFSLQKRIIPRAFVVQYLLMKGLRKKCASLVTPFFWSEELFLSKYVFCFKEESDYLLKLYEENMNHTYTKENMDMPFIK